jgi:hypothetical protein
MIHIHHFNEAHRQYQDGRIPFRLLQDQAAVMNGICSNPRPGITNAMEVTEDDIQWLLQQQEAGIDYSDLLGGDVHVCDTEADLKQIHGCNFKWAEAHEGQWPNVNTAGFDQIYAVSGLDTLRLCVLLHQIASLLGLRFPSLKRWCGDSRTSRTAIQAVTHFYKGMDNE